MERVGPASPPLESRMHRGMAATPGPAWVMPTIRSPGAPEQGDCAWADPDGHSTPSASAPASPSIDLMTTDNLMTHSRPKA
ncbi:hypothetical protein GCM10009081_15020 [Brevundimonas nasdae]